MLVLTVGVRSAVNGPTWRTSAATSPSVANGQAITGQATTNAM
jgi:hypothetical protein